MGQSISVVNNHRPSPYVEQWMLGIQYSPTPSDVIDITYVGNHGLKMVLSGANRNQLPPQYLSETTQLNNPVTNPFYGHVSGSGCGLSNPTVSSFQLLLPYAEFCDSISNGQAPVGFSNYNALQATYTHKITAGSECSRLLYVLEVHRQCRGNHRLVLNRLKRRSELLQPGGRTLGGRERHAQ